ncbi:MAG: prepilin-type N-terminal cleavage/methylation domain-containing protein [Deltaproteobacteria bacterium]|nr:prepilin-type N-terminal cleavage/methylation domain-containing protein [Deltaproteobacteria bacterium]
MDRINSKKGFTLIEVVIAILIFALGIIGVAKMQAEAVKGNSFSMQVTDGLNLAQNQLESLMSLPYIHNSLNNGTHNPPGTASGTGCTYTITWVVQDDTPVTGVKQIDVTSSWAEKNVPHSITISFIRGQP